MARQVLNPHSIDPFAPPNTGLSPDFGDTWTVVLGKLNAMLTELYSSTVIGTPVASVVGNIATWGNITGSSLLDSGKKPIGAPGSTIVGHLAAWGDTNGGSLVDGGTPSFPWFNVKTYGAVGDGVADDRSAINSAIAAFNAAARGVLYFPAGIYKVTASLTTVTANGKIVGDGIGGLDGVSNAASLIKFTSGSTTLFTITNDGLLFDSLALQCTAGSVTAGAGIVVTRSGQIANGITISGQTVNYNNCAFKGFWINVDVQCGTSWAMHNCVLVNGVQYGMRVRNLVNADEGDYSITSTVFMSNLQTDKTHFYTENSGGLKIANCKFNSFGVQNGYGIGIEINATGGSTADCQITNCSIENFNILAIKIDGHAFGWPGIMISNIETLCDHSILNHITIANVVNPVLSGLSSIGPGPTNFVAFTNVTNGAVCTNVLTDSTGPTGADLASWVGAGPSGSAVSLSRAPGSSGAGNHTARNDVGDSASLTVCGSAHSFANLRGRGAILSDNDLLLITDDTGNNGGGHNIWLQPGGLSETPVVKVLAPNTGGGGGLLQLHHNNNFSANGAVATVLGSIGPTGSRTTVQKWMTIKDGAGNPFYIPCF